MNHQFNIEIANLSCNWAIANQTCYNKYIQLVCGCFCGEILGKILQIMSSLQAWIANLKFWSHSDVKCAFQIMLHVTSHCGNFYYAWPITSLEWRAKRGQSITVGYCLLTDSGGDKFDLNPRSYLLLVYEETIPNTYKKKRAFQSLATHRSRNSVLQYIVYPCSQNGSFACGACLHTCPNSLGSQAMSWKLDKLKNSFSANLCLVPCIQKQDCTLFYIFFCPSHLTTTSYKEVLFY